VLGQDFTFTKIVDQNMRRPDNGALFANPHGASTDGKYVVFNEQGGELSLWSADINTLALTRLAHVSNAVPSGTGNFTGFGHIGGGPYGGFGQIVRNGNVVFFGVDSGGQGIYTVPATGGTIRRVFNYNNTLPSGYKTGLGGNLMYAIGLSENGVVGFTGAANGPPSAGVYTVRLDGSNLNLIADDLHRFRNPLQPSGGLNNCPANFGGAVAIENGQVVFIGHNGGAHWGIYAQPEGSPAQGTDANNCGTGPVGPLVTGSGTKLPGDPVPGNQIPDYDFVQTDGTSAFFHGSDWVVGCCSSVNGTFGGIWSVPLTGGTPTKIVANGDTLPVVGKVTNVGTQFSVDAGGVVFIAVNETQDPVKRGVFLYSRGQIKKVFADGDSLNGGTLTPNGNLEIWPQCYKNGKIAFAWAGGIFVAASTTPTAPPSVRTGGVVSASAYGTASAVAPGSWIEIFGSNFATHSRQWASADFRGNIAPTSLDGTSVTIGGQPAFVNFVSETQVNAQVPSTLGVGPQQVVVTNAAGSSAAVSITVTQTQPGLLAPPSFSVGGRQYVTALFPDGVTYVLPPGSIASINSRRARPGDTIILYGIGFGAVQPATPAGQIAAGSTSIASPLQISIGGTAANVPYAGLAPGFVGLYQFNVVVPNIAAGDSVPLTFTLNGVAGSQTLVIPVQN
jgi:uncharacterized protein (TIGR03437 family)